MKKALFIIASLALVASCAKTIEFNESKEDKSSELTVKTIANPTRAIAESTVMPYNNVIGFLPYYHSDIMSSDYTKYNNFSPFAYDSERGAWRGISFGKGLETKAVLDDMLKDTYGFSPVYWPAGDRVYMDYVAYACTNFMTLLGKAVQRYSGGELSEEEITELLSQVIYLQPKPIVKNPNRMDVDYNNIVLNLAGYILMENVKSPILRPTVLKVALALCILADVPTGFDIEITSDDVMTLITCLINGEDPEELMKKLQNSGIMQFLEDYETAYKMITEAGRHDEEILTREKGSRESMLTEELFNEVVNHAYLIYMNGLPRVSKYIQDDLMYASDRNLKNNYGGSVQAVFNHSKAWVKVVVNNQTRNDIFVNGVVFNNVKNYGTLIIDNSKSEFEAYWDFSGFKPYVPEPQPTPETVGAGFESYTQVDLESHTMVKSSAVMESKRASKFDFGELEEVFGEMTSMGLIPDEYFVPSGCYGPARNIQEVQGVSPSPQPIVDSAIVEQVVPISISNNYLHFEFLKGSEDFDSEIARNLGGAMFPSQEPGTISVAYYTCNSSISKEEPVNMTINRPAETRYFNADIPMGSFLRHMSRGIIDDNLQVITLNLPRVYWQMGKVYIYVINISDNEVTINPIVKDWEPADENPIVGPVEYGYRSEGTETFGEGSTEGWFAN